MDKRSIVGIAVVALLFLGFAFFNAREQKKLQEQKAIWEAYQDSLAAVQRAAQPEVDSLALEPGVQDSATLAAHAAAARERQVETLGETLTAAREAEPASFTVENDVMTVSFSTLGGQITDVTLKDYTKYGPRGERHEPIRLMDPSTARFALSFYVKNGLRNIPVNTMDYVFEAGSVETTPEGAQRVTMRLPVSDAASLEYVYLIYNTQSPERDYLVDFDVRLNGMSREMANQTQIQIDWSNTSYQNEKGFKNENMYTTLAYRFPG